MRPIDVNEPDGKYHALDLESYKYICSLINVLSKLSDAIDDNLTSTATTWSSDKINNLTKDAVQTDEMVLHNLAEINALLNISDDELRTYRELIDDSNVYDDKTFSSAKIDSLISNLERTKAVIDDLNRTINTTWSSRKIMNEINQKIYKLDFVEVNANDDKEYLIPLENACKLTVQEGGKLVLPTTTEPVEIHVVFEGASLSVFQMPTGVKWQDGIKPIVSGGKTYELIFQYVDGTIGWTAAFLEYKVA